MNRKQTLLSLILAPMTGCAVLVGAATAGATTPTCREWQAEHRAWKARAVRLYLDGSAPRELDAALFELVQREAWLTACDLSVEGARAELVGWRLVDRPPEEYGAAVVESVLERSGLGLGLRPRFENALAGAPRDSRRVSADAVPGATPRRVAD